MQLESDEQAIREVHVAWIEAVNAGNLDHLLAWMADDVMFLSPGQSPFGREVFSANFSSAHQQFRIHCVSEFQAVRVVGEVAYSVARDSLSVIPCAGGAESRLAGYRLTVYRKQSDGRWLLARDAHTLSAVER